MKHYDYVEWMFYKNGMLSEKKSEEMEQHLYNCDTCMEIFLSLIDENEEEKAGEFISDDFASKVISNVPKIKSSSKRNKQATKSFYYQFGYYAAVASVTIILTLSGFYVNLVDAVPKVSASIELTEEYSNKISEFSNRIVDSTSSLLLSIENSENNWRENNER